MGRCEVFIISIDDIIVTRIIFDRFSKEFRNNIDVDVAIAGAGPAGLTAAKYLAAAGKKTIVFERKLSDGGGMWGGGMTFPVIVIQQGSQYILDDVGVRITNEGKGYYSADSIEVTTKLCSAAIDAGARIFNAISVEDVLLHKNKVNGLIGALSRLLGYMSIRCRFVPSIALMQPVMPLRSVRLYDGRSAR